MSNGALMLGFEKPPPPASPAGKGARRAVFLGRKLAFQVAECDRWKWQGAIARCCKVRSYRVAPCEVRLSQGAKFGCRRVRCSGVAPCDLFLIILRDSGGNAKVDANITRARDPYIYDLEGSCVSDGHRSRTGDIPVIFRFDGAAAHLV